MDHNPAYTYADLDKANIADGHYRRMDADLVDALAALDEASQLKTEYWDEVLAGERQPDPAYLLGLELSEAAAEANVREIRARQHIAPREAQPVAVGCVVRVGSLFM